MVGTFKSLKIKVEAMDLVLASLPVAVIVLIIVWLNNILFDKYLDKKYTRKKVKHNE
ncbi:membrane protein [Staphylococcus gallinarum]|nr:membrane protein [Staphylococcus gallinarum]